MVPRTWINGIQFTRRDGARTTLLIPTTDHVIRRPEAREPTRSRTRERGAVLLLATLSLTLLVVVIVQLSVSSTVDQAVARSELEFTRVEYAARAGMEVAKAVLLSEERPTGRTLQLASDLTVDISFESEDGKLNVLWLACEDTGTRDEWRERFVRLLDGLREGSALDLSLGEAESIVKGIEKHLTVERPPEMPVPALSTMLQEQSKLAWSESKFSDLIEEPVLYPFGLQELAHVEGVTDGLIHGEEWGGQRLLGLRDVMTVYTSLVWDPNDALAPDPFVWPFQKLQKGWRERHEKKEAARIAAIRSMSEDSGQGRVDLLSAKRHTLQVLLPKHVELGQAGHLIRNPEKPQRESPSIEELIILIEEAMYVPLTMADKAILGSISTDKSHVFTCLVKVSSDNETRPAEFKAIAWRRGKSDEKASIVTIAPLRSTSKSGPSIPRPNK